MIRKIEDWIFRWLSGDPSDHCVAPGDRLWHEFGPMDGDRPMFVASTSNDGYELWLSYTLEKGYLAHYRMEEARRLAWIILWHWWGVSTWFGLKRKIWYWSLSRQVKRQKRSVGDA